MIHPYWHPDGTENHCRSLCVSIQAAQLLQSISHLSVGKVWCIWQLPFPPGELPNGSVKAELLGVTSKDEVIGFTLRRKISARPDGFNKAKLVSSLLAQTGWFLCVQGYGWRRAAPACPMEWQALPAVTACRAATSPRRLTPSFQHWNHSHSILWRMGRRNLLVSAKGASTLRAALAWGSGRKIQSRSLFFRVNWVFVFNFGRFWVKTFCFFCVCM